MEQVGNIALEEQATQVTAIHLGIGPLSGVEPWLLEQAFSITRAGSIAADAELVVKSMPIQVSCKQCGQLTEALPSRLVCGSCGDWRTSLISGDELELTSIELVRDIKADESEKMKDTEKQIKGKRPKIQAGS